MRLTPWCARLCSLVCMAPIGSATSAGRLPPDPVEKMAIPQTHRRDDIPGGVDHRGGAAATSQYDDRAERTRLPDVLFVPTPQEVIEKMLEVAGAQEGNTVFDLGCGDGRIVVTAALKYGVRAVGIDIDEQRVREARENVKRNGVSDLVTIKQGDIFEEDFSEADVVTLYLLPRLNERLKPKLERLKPGSRIVSHSFPMKGAKPAKVVLVKTRGGATHTIYLWVLPWEEE